MRIFKGQVVGFEGLIKMDLSYPQHIQTWLVLASYRQVDLITNEIVLVVILMKPETFLMRLEHQMKLGRNIFEEGTCMLIICLVL